METPTPESTEHTVATDGTVHPAEATSPAPAETPAEHPADSPATDPVMPEAPPIEGASEHYEDTVPEASAPEADAMPATPEPGTSVAPDSAGHEGWRDQTVLPEPAPSTEPETPAPESAEAASPAASAPAAAEIHGTTIVKTEDSPAEADKSPEAAESTTEPATETPTAETANDSEVDTPPTEAPAATPETDTRPAVEVAVEAVKRIFDEAPDIDTALEQWKQLEDAQNERLLEKIKAHFESEHSGESKAA